MNVIALFALAAFSRAITVSPNAALLRDTVAGEISAALVLNAGVVGVGHGSVFLRRVWLLGFSRDKLNHKSSA